MLSRYWWVLVIGFVVGPMAGFLIAAVITYVMPKQYESTAVVEIRVRQTDNSDPRGQPWSRFFAKEMGLITTRPVLDNAVYELDFVNKWGVDQETATAILKDRIQVRQLHGTDLVSVSARFTNKEDARDMVAGVVASYSDYRNRMLEESLQASVNGVRKAVREQEDRVEERRKVLTLIARKGDTSDLGKQDHVDAKLELESEMALLEQLKLKLITEEIGADILDSVIVIHDEPVIAHSPISPNVTLNLVLGAAGGFLLSPLFTLPVMWLLSRRKQIA